MQNKTKDTMVTFRSTIRGKNSKGGDRFQLYITTEQTQALIQELTNTLENERGAKIDLHITKKTAKDSGREFDSSIAFVRATQEGGFGAGAPKKTYVAKGTPVTASTTESSAALREKIARVKKEMA